MNTKSKERRKYIAKVKRFATSQAGLAKISKIAPEAATVIKEHPEYLDIPQYRNDARVSGIYQCEIFGKPFYVGSSGNVYLRLCEHIYNFCTDPAAFGACWTRETPAHFSIIASGVSIPEHREAMEFGAIKAVNPVLQYTDPSSADFGRDKPLASGETRESLRTDICVTVPLRIERFKKIQEEAAAK